MAPDPLRLDPATFQLPVGRMRAGYYSDAYFNSTKELLEAEDRHPQVKMQVFQKQDTLLGGVDEAIAVLRVAAGHVGDDGIWVPAWDDLTVHALHEGDVVAPFETVMTIEGDYAQFAHLETVYLGSMARRSLVMRNVRDVVAAARGKEILFFPARHDHWLVQTGDGWAAHIAGAIGVSTDAQASWWGGRGVGTVPHALIAAYDGDTVAASRAFAHRYGHEINVTVLVDFDNHSARTAVEVADALGDELWGVRLDTSERLVDETLADLGEDAPRGARRRRPSARAHRGLRRLRRREDPRLRGAGRARRRLRRRLLAPARAERLHGRHRHRRRPPAGEGRARGPPEPAPAAGDVTQVAPREPRRPPSGASRRRWT
jgi:nicotinate phosphoribosyltransferase